MYQLRKTREAAKEYGYQPSTRQPVTESNLFRIKSYEVKVISLILLFLLGQKNLSKKKKHSDARCFQVFTLSDS
jgi:hypothetical protein